MPPDSDVGQYAEPTPAPTNAEHNTPGVVGQNAKLGYKPLPKAEPEEKTYRGDEAGLREAARDHAESRGSPEPSEPEPFVSVPDDGGKYALSVEEATRLQTQEKEFRKTINDVLETDAVQFSVDAGRYLAQAVQEGKIDFAT